MSDTDRPEVDVETLDYDGAETHSDSIEGEVTRHYWECPNCGFPLAAWTDCPDCQWYDEDAWERTDTEAGIMNDENDQPERRLIGSKLSAQHVLSRGEEIDPGVYRIEYEDGATVVCEFAYATITEAER